MCSIWNIKNRLMNIRKILDCKKMRSSKSSSQYIPRFICFR